MDAPRTAVVSSKPNAKPAKKQGKPVTWLGTCVSHLQQHGRCVCGTLPRPYTASIVPCPCAPASANAQQQRACLCKCTAAARAPRGPTCAARPAGACACSGGAAAGLIVSVTCRVWPLQLRYSFGYARG